MISTDGHHNVSWLICTSKDKQVPFVLNLYFSMYYIEMVGLYPETEIKVGIEKRTLWYAGMRQ